MLWFYLTIKLDLIFLHIEFNIRLHRRISLKTGSIFHIINVKPSLTHYFTSGLYVTRGQRRSSGFILALAESRSFSRLLLLTAGEGVALFHITSAILQRPPMLLT